MALADEFQRECEGAVQKCRRLGYLPSIWIGMMQTHGAVEAAKRLLRNGDLQPGVLRLLRLSRPDLTIEHAVLNTRRDGLFDDQDRELAAWRLAQAEQAR